MLFAVGQREVETGSVAVRRLGSKKQRVVSVEEALDELLAEISERR